MKPNEITGDASNLTTSRLAPDVLVEFGLKKTTAYIETEASASARRNSKARELREANGIRQLNLEVQDEHREIFQILHKQLKAGEPVAKTLSALAQLYERPRNGHKSVDIKFENGAKDAADRIAPKLVPKPNPNESLHRGDVSRWKAYWRYLCELFHRFIGLKVSVSEQVFRFTPGGSGPAR